MQYVIVVFRSRNVSVGAYNFLLSQGANCSLVSTPRAVNVGCGLSVKMSIDTYRQYATKLSSANTFVGAFVVSQRYNGTFFTRL